MASPKQPKSKKASATKAKLTSDAAASTDWRPLVSYTTNLTRVGDHMLGTRSAWEKLSQLRPAGQRGPFLLQLFATQFPWYWSAGVLIAIVGFSLCILNFSIKPLDRLK